MSKGSMMSAGIPRRMGGEDPTAAAQSLRADIGILVSCNRHVPMVQARSGKLAHRVKTNVHAGMDESPTAENQLKL
jgi:hypothetical protein